MQNQPDYKKAFETAITKLCRAVDNDGAEKLKNILSQEKNDIEMFLDIYLEYPQFRKYFSEEIGSN